MKFQEKIFDGVYMIDVMDDFSGIDMVYYDNNLDLWEIIIMDNGNITFSYEHIPINKMNDIQSKVFNAMLDGYFKIIA